MAVAPTGAIYKALEFDGVSSRTYGVYITGEAVYNAPERDVEMITIPGRSGAFALDNGRFQNIEVSYPAGIFAETEADFRQAISDFRNFLCSRNGYVRLQDEYNPDEYRMAVYKSGLEVDPAMLKAGEFEIVFDCKPQRWLTSGETEVTIVNSGDTITNPTLFEASPLLEVYGEGDIVVNGGNISVTGNPYGLIQVAPPIGKNSDWSSIYIDDALLETGDTITLSGFKVVCTYTAKDGYVISDFRVSSTYTENATGYVSGLSATAQYEPVTLAYGTAYSDWDSYVRKLGIIIEYTYGGQSFAESGTIALQFKYDGSTRIQYRALYSFNSVAKNDFYISSSAIMANSTKSIPFNPIYIDLDIGEAWTEDGGEIRNANNAVALEANLPVLSSGTNEITFDNTVTDLKVIPRWWKI